MAHAGGTKLGPYEILSLLGAGGMGEVYRARDPRLGRDVAIKVLPPEIVPDAERLKRFELEARAVGALNHPNVLSVFDIGSESGAPYIVSELLEGQTLRERLRDGPPSARKAADIAAQIARGLAAAHEKGVVHRDLKPENVFLTKDDRVKILDFGLAKLIRRGENGSEATASPTESILTGAGVVFGTVGYMSPEQVRGEPADHRSDFFSFGTILYEMLSGKNPFRAATAAETMTAILKEEPSLSLPAFTAAPGLSLIVARCLDKSPARRFQSSEDMAFALEALSQPFASLAGPAPRLGTASRLRNPALIGALLLVLLAGGFAMTRLLKTGAPQLKFTQVTFGMSGLGAARFAPDGQTIVFSAYGGSRDEKGAPIGELFTARIGSPEPRALGIKGANILSISGSGEMLVSLRREGQAHTWTLARVSLGGGVPREILEDAGSAVWGPDGESIAAIHWVGDQRRIEYPLGHVLVDSGVGRLIEFSPNGKLMSFGGGDQSLVVTDLQGKKKVVKGFRGGFGHHWLPDGKGILSFSSNKGSTDVFAVTLGGDRKLLVSWPGDYYFFDMAPDGRLLVRKVLNAYPVYARVPGETRDRQLHLMSGAEPADLSDDGRTLLFTVSDAASGDKGAVYIGGIDGSPAKRLGEGSAMRLARDGKLALCSLETETLVLMPTGAGLPRTLPPMTGVSYEDGGFHPDGRHVWFNVTEPGGKGRCYLQSMDGGEPRPITRQGVSCGDFSPDGKWLLVSEATARAGFMGIVTKYQLQAADGGPSREGPVLEEGEKLIRWSSDGRWVFTRTRTRPMGVYRIDPFSGRRELHAEVDLSGATDINRLPVAMNGDGTAMVWEFVRGASDFYVVEGLK